MSTTDATVSPSAPRIPSRTPASDGTQPLRAWHDPPRHPLLCLCFKALCLIAISKPSVEHWDDLIHDRNREEWVEHKKMVTDRLANMNVTAGLVLTTSAVFISTQPPFQPLMPYASTSESSSSNFIRLTYAQGRISFKFHLLDETDTEIVEAISLAPRMLPYTDGISVYGLGSFNTGVTDRFVRTSRFEVGDLKKAFSAVFIAGFTSDKLFVKS
ncbi:hypothetical protein F4604DRAFT_1922495 [Suillus subluteus]|nr:hypothetical protein F4604DRAFT_1922495 [Suillus subluteus]